MSDEARAVEKNAAYAVKNVIANEVQSPLAVTEPANNKSSSPILKLDIDCFEQLFEWLPMTEILFLRQTCKRLKQVIDNYIKEKFPALKIGYGKEALHENFDDIRQIVPSCAKLIKSITVCTDIVNIQYINEFKDILSQVETLIISGVPLEPESRQAILTHCINLKHLSFLSYNEIKIDNENEWLLQKFPTLEHLEIAFDGESSMLELKTFLELNPNVRRFSTFATLPLKDILQNLLGSNIKLDQLDIAVNCLLTEMEECLNLLNRLYDQGLYKRLHFYARFLYDSDEIHRIASVRGLEKLYLGVVLTVPSLPPLPQLKEFCFMADEDEDELYSLETVAKDLLNVDRVYLRLVNSDQLTQFIRHAPKVKEIKVQQLVEGIHYERLVIDLIALNKERKQLPGACKVTLYVDDFVFVATKRVLLKTEFNMIQLKRANAVEWEHALFYY